MVATDKTCPLSTAQVRSNFLESMIESKNFKLWFAQARVLHHALQGENIFFTGPAGSGKSYLLKEITRALREKHGVSIR